jgi:hypothetical protein
MYTMKNNKENKMANMTSIKVANDFEINKDDVKILKDVLDQYLSQTDKYDEFAQGRTNFQIEKFIGVEEATPAAAYAFSLLQTRVMRAELHREVKEAIEYIRTFEYKWKNKDKNEPIWWGKGDNEKLCWYDTDESEFMLKVHAISISVKDKLLQLKTFDKMLSSMEEKNGRPFTREQFQAEEPEYWKLRFMRQMTDAVIGRMTGMSEGDVKSARMAIAPSPIPESNNQIKDFPNLLDAYMNAPNPTAVISNIQGFIQNLAETEGTRIAEGISSPEDAKTFVKEMANNILSGLEGYKAELANGNTSLSAINQVNNALMNAMSNLGTKPIEIEDKSSES